MTGRPVDRTVARSASNRSRARRAHRSVRSIDVARRVLAGRVRQTFVEHHGDVRAELRLDVGRLFRRQQMRRAVEMRAETHALFVDRAARGKAEHLVAAAVGEDRPSPADEAVQAAAPRDEVVARPQVQVVGIAEQDLRADRFEIAVGDTLHRALRADRHERGRLDLAVRRAS